MGVPSHSLILASRRPFTAGVIAPATCCIALLLAYLCCLAGITDDMLRGPGLPTLAPAWQAVLDFVRTHTPAGSRPVLVAHNGFAFDFKMLCSCLMRVQQQQQQQQHSGCAGACPAASSSTGGSSSAIQLVPQHWLTMDGLHIARTLKLKQLAALDNLKQGDCANVCAFVCMHMWNSVCASVRMLGWGGVGVGGW